MNGGVELGIGDIDLERARTLALGHENAIPYKVDVRRADELASVLKGYEAVLNASWYEFNLQVMKVAFKAGCHYNDLGGLFHTTRRQLELDADARRHGITAIVGGGESPGITNVMCAYGAQGLKTVRSLKIFAGARESAGVRRKDSGVAFPFSISTVLDEYTKKPVEYLNGKFVEVPPLSGSEDVDFPAPVGKNTCHYSLHSEPATLPFTMGPGVRDVEFKLGISTAMTRTLSPLISLGLTSEEKLRVNGIELTPKQFLVSFFNSKEREGDAPARAVALRTLVSGHNRKRPITVVCDLVCESMGPVGIANATAYLTGIAGSVFTQLLAAGKIRERGVIAPEKAVTPDDFASRLSCRGLTIRKSTH